MDKIGNKLTAVFFHLWLVKILLKEAPLEGKEKKRKKVLLGTKIQAGGDRSKSILDYVDETLRPISNSQAFVGGFELQDFHIDAYGTF